MTRAGQMGTVETASSGVSGHAGLHIRSRTDRQRRVGMAQVMWSDVWGGGDFGSSATDGRGKPSALVRLVLHVGSAIAEQQPLPRLPRACSMSTATRSGYGTERRSCVFGVPT